MSRASQFTDQTRRDVYAKATSKNAEGFPTFDAPAKERYLQVLLTNTLGNTFYTQADKLLDESIEMHRQMATAEPLWTAKALVFARNEGFMRLQPIAGLVALARAGSSDPLARSVFLRAFNRVIQTPGDLQDFVIIARGGRLSKTLSTTMKRAIRGYLERLSEYHAIKYGSDNQEYSLKDIARLTHPKADTPKQNRLLRWLVRREEVRTEAGLFDVLPQIGMYERFLAETDPAKLVELIEAGRLPHEVVTQKQLDMNGWKAVVKQMPYFALLRNLNTLDRHGLFNDGEVVDSIAKRLGDVEALRKAKVLPFRLYSAYKALNGNGFAHQRLRNVLAQVMDDALLTDLPEMRTLIAPDVSGSMSGGYFGNVNLSVAPAEIAGIFTGALLKTRSDAMVLPFQDTVVPVTLNARDSVMSIAEQISKLGGGGTSCAAPVAYLLDRRISIDLGIFLTDNEEWVGARYGIRGTVRGWAEAWQEYTRRINPKAKAVVVTLTPDRARINPVDMPGVYNVYGWGDQVIRYIGMVAQDRSQVDTVEVIEL